MEKATGINRWWLNPKRKRLVEVRPQSSLLRTAFERCLSTFVRSRHRFASLDFRLPLPGCCERLFRGYRNGRVLIASLADKFRCPEDSVDKLSEQKPCRGIDRSRRKFVSDSFHDIGERICRTRVLAGSLSVVRKLVARCALANPLAVNKQVSWPKSMRELKSITTIYSHNLLSTFGLQRFPKTLTGQ